MGLPNSGTCSYNGVAFASMYKSKGEVKPIKDSAGRALVGREYTLDVDGYLAASPGSTTDGTLAAMRIALEKPSGALVYTNKGFGALSVNAAGGALRDLAYGPWPEVLAWDPIGNDQGCRVRWRVTTRVPCEENPRTKGIVEYCYEESWTIDEDGYTTRTIAGHLTIQATRAAVDNRSITDNADAYRDQVVPDLPVGFKRKQSYKLSEDKRTLNFQFEDAELPQPLPNGVTKADVTQTDKWTLPKGGNKNLLTSTISGSITLPARSNPSFAWGKIMLILQSRWLKGPIGVSLVGGAMAKVSVCYILQNIEISRELFGRSVRFSASVLVLPPAEAPAFILAPGVLLQTTGLWKPIPNTTFVAWKGSVFARNGSGLPYAPRGVAGMSFQNQDDAIVDLCGGQQLRSINAQAPGQSRVLKSMVPRQPNGAILDPNASWLQYRLRLRLLENDRIARHKPLIGTSQIKTVPPLDGFLTSDYQTSPGLQVTDGLGGALSGDVSSAGGQGAGYVAPALSGEITQQVSAPKYTIRLEGHAVRLGYGIPTPRLATIGAITVKQTHQHVSQEQVGTIGGVPIYAASWALDYAMPYANAETLPMPVNPAVW